MQLGTFDVDDMDAPALPSLLAEVAPGGSSAMSDAIALAYTTFEQPIEMAHERVLVVSSGHFSVDEGLAQLVADHAFEGHYLIGVGVGGIATAALLSMLAQDASAVGKCLLILGIVAFAGLALATGMPILAAAIQSGWWQPLVIPLLALPLVLSAFWWMSAPTHDGRGVLIELPASASISRLPKASGSTA